MVWRIEFDPAAAKSLEKLGPDTARRVLRFLNERVALLDDPRGIGAALKGSRLNEFWKYRVGDYRIICHIEDRQLRIIVIRIGQRRDVYKPR